MQRSLIKDFPEPRDQTPFLYAFVVVKGGGCRKQCMEQPMQVGSCMQWTVLEADGRQVEAVKVKERWCNVQTEVACGAW